MTSFIGWVQAQNQPCTLWLSRWRHDVEVLCITHPFVRVIHWLPVDSPHKGTVMWSFDIFVVAWNKLLNKWLSCSVLKHHYNDVIMGVMASQITSLTIVYSIVYSGSDQRKHQSSASLAFVRENSPVTGQFPAQRASNVENVSIWWRHHVHVSSLIIFKGRRTHFCHAWCFMWLYIYIKIYVQENRFTVTLQYWVTQDYQHPSLCNFRENAHNMLSKIII